MRSTSRLFVAALLLVATGSCGDGNGPRPFTAAFALTTVNGSPPPALVGATVSCDEYLDAALLSLLDDGTFTLHSEVKLDCTRSGGTVSFQQGDIPGTYSRRGTMVNLQVQGGPPIAATYTGTSLTGTIPAGPYTFPIAIDVVFVQLLPL